MTQQSLALNIAIASYGHTAALLNSEVPIKGVTPNFLNINPIIAAFRRMVRNVEFDVCEMAPATYMIARSMGAPFKALPIFIMRRFHHSGLVVHPDGPIKKPKDLEGKKVGVRAYSVSTGIWTRGILQNHFDVDINQVTWMVDDEEHVQELILPPNVKHVKEGQSLVSMMQNGELQAAFSGPAGIGRAGAPKDGWDSKGHEEIAYQELFSNHEEVERQWYEETQIYPTHGLIVVKDSLMKDHPWLAQSLMDAFESSKNLYTQKILSGQCVTDVDQNYLKLSKIVGDPLPYGTQANLPAIKALMQYCYQQRLLPKLYDLEEMFVPL
jgi:4,5-dihydroxyphthalate decarboxylase